MRSLFICVLAIISIFSLHAQPPEGQALPGDIYGAKPNTSSITKIKKIPSKLEKTDTVYTTVKAKVMDVCSVKGCWIKLAIDDDQTAFVKMKDYAFFVPMAAINKEVVLEGKAFKKVTSVEELKHYAEDAGKNQAEIDAITEPKEEIRFLASGIQVLK